MRLWLGEGLSRYEPENICRLFLPHEAVELADSPVADDGVCAAAYLDHRSDGAAAIVRLCCGDFDCILAETVDREDPLISLWGKPEELTVCALLYKLFCECFGTCQPWGLLTGVRPVKLLRRLVRDAGEETACRYFRDRLLVSEEKTALALRTLHAEDRILALSARESCSLYVSVPFCPTRCSYCSFVSQTTERSAHLIPDYVRLMTKEIEKTGDIVRALGLRLDSIYIGGGTPTTLSAPQLDDVMGAVRRSFDLSGVMEYTVEAGRPDTVTRDKLEAIAVGGATRLSINPQTLDDRVLCEIGRRHTTAQFYDAFALARDVGFTHINTDLIAGLPTDTKEGFFRSLDGVLDLSPESVTVHTLSMKRASHLVIRGREDYDAGGDTPQMVSYAAKRLTEEGYHPYYLYRQSRCVGNQENTGWSKDGHDGLYNVFMMDETHTVLGVGAGAVTKLKCPDGEHLERVFNYKFPYEYIDRFEEMLNRKQQVVNFYEANGFPENA